MWGGLENLHFTRLLDVAGALSSIAIDDSVLNCLRGVLGFLKHLAPRK